MPNNTTPETQDPGGGTVLVKKQKTIITILVAVILALIVFLLYALINNKRDAANENKDAVLNNQEVVSNQAAENEPPITSEDTPSSQTTTPSSDTSPSNTETPAAETTAKKPDLYVAGYSFSKDPKSGEEFEVRIKIGNKGNAKAESFHWQWWATHAKADCDGKISNLSAGETKTVGCKFTYASWSAYDTKAVVDAESEIDESNEDNNVATKKVTPIHDTAKPDISITDYKFNHPPKMGEPFTVSISVYNNGDAASGAFWWEWWPTHASHACREKIDSLVAHGGKVVSCTYTYASWSTYATKAVVDADNEIDESNEGDNTHAENVIPIH